MRDYFEKEICVNCCIDKQFCERCGVRKKMANPEKEKPELMVRLYESDKNCDGDCKNCVAICGTTQNTIFLEAADEIEELLAEKTKLENSGKLLAVAFDRLKERVPKWHPASDPPTRSNPKYAREDFLVRLESGLIKSLTYEFDNSDRCLAGCEPLFPVGWRKTATPVTHWARIPKFELPKEVE